MHPILRYMQAHGIKSQRAFAKITGLSRQSINDFVVGRHQPGRNAAKTIERTTSGEVTIAELFAWERPKGRRRKMRRRPAPQSEASASAQ